MFRDEKIDVYRVTSCCMVLSQLEFQVNDQSGNILAQTDCENISSNFLAQTDCENISSKGMGEVASPKSLDGGEKINSILNFCDSAEGIYDAFINPKYKVGEHQFIIFMELNGIDLGRNRMGVQDAEHQLLRGQHRLDHQEHLWSSLPLHCRHVQQHFVSKISIQI